MSAQKATDIEGSIEAGHAEQVRNVLSTIVGAELDDRDFEPDEDKSAREVMDEIDPVEVTLEEVVRGCPVPEAKCWALLEESAGEPGTGISKVDGESERYVVDPAR
jgi:hypothetical protein